MSVYVDDGLCATDSIRSDLMPWLCCFPSSASLPDEDGLHAAIGVTSVRHSTNGSASLPRLSIPIPATEIVQTAIPNAQRSLSPNVLLHSPTLHFLILPLSLISRTIALPSTSRTSMSHHARRVMTSMKDHLNITILRCPTPTRYLLLRLILHSHERRRSPIRWHTHPVSSHMLHMRRRRGGATKALLKMRWRSIQFPISAHTTRTRRSRRLRRLTEESTKVLIWPSVTWVGHRTGGEGTLRHHWTW